MVQLPTVSEADTREALTETPLDDYQLIDFGAGRKLERWGPYLVDSPDRQATGVCVRSPWQADWVFVSEVGRRGHWQSAREGLATEWMVRVGGRTLTCRLESRGRVGLRGRDLPCGDWVRRRLEGCYDLGDLRVLNLFAGNGYVTAEALAGGASVVHVDASEEMLALARARR
jgi:23S rRNA (cytosine1962-C5)-methyltransferase